MFKKSFVWIFGCTLFSATQLLAQTPILNDEINEKFIELKPSQIQESFGEHLRAGLYIGQMKNDAEVRCGIRIHSFYITTNQPQKVLIQAEAIDLEEQEEPNKINQYEKLFLSQATQKSGKVLPQIWLGHKLERIEENLASVLRIELTTSGAPIAFAYSSNIYPTAPVVKPRYDDESEKWITAPYKEIECVSMKIAEEN